MVFSLLAENSGVPLPASGKKPSKRAIKQAASKATKDFIVEYAKSSRAVCRGCEIKIAKVFVQNLRNVSLNRFINYEIDAS